jgi:hypothetical protein
MNCVIHYQMPAVTVCRVCGSGLCPECASAQNPPVCKNCLSRHYTRLKKEYITSFVLSAILAVLTIAFGIYSVNSKSIPLSQISIINLLVVGLWFGSFPQGWMGLGRIPRNLLIFGTGVYSVDTGHIEMSGIMLLGIRLCLAVILGPLFLLIRLIQYFLFVKKIQ